MHLLQRPLVVLHCCAQHFRRLHQGIANPGRDYLRLLFLFLRALTAPGLSPFRQILLRYLERRQNASIE
jgi:hypothetical protein